MVGFMKQFLYLGLVISMLWSCSRSSDTERFQSKRNNVIVVKDKVKEIEMEEVEISSISSLFLMDDYLIIGDYKSYDKQIYFFDRNDFRFITSTADLGQGPHEITVMGHIGTDTLNRNIYVSDHGKRCIFSYNIDSVFANPLYTPEVKMKMSELQFPSRYEYINDTLCIGLIIEPISVSDFEQFVAQWNMNTGAITPMKYSHPDVEKKRINFAVSMEHGIYVECYAKQNLLTICTLDGELVTNVYGKNWNKKPYETEHFRKAVFCGDKIVIAYNGGLPVIKDKLGALKSNLPTKLMVFELNGDYLQTLEVGYDISDFCYDKTKNRLIMCFNDEIQFGYLELDNII